MPGQRLLNRVAIVTGSTQGIGREIAKQFHLEGAHLVCADLQPLGMHNTRPFSCVKLEVHDYLLTDL